MEEGGTSVAVTSVTAGFVAGSVAGSVASSVVKGERREGKEREGEEAPTSKQTVGQGSRESGR